MSRKHPHWTWLLALCASPAWAQQPPAPRPRGGFVPVLGGERPSTPASNLVDEAIRRALEEDGRGEHAAALERLRSVARTTPASAKLHYFLGKLAEAESHRAADWAAAKSLRDEARRALSAARDRGTDASFPDNARWAEEARTRLAELSRGGSLSERAKAQMADLLKIARTASRGRRPDGRCYAHVCSYLERVGRYGRFGRLADGFGRLIPARYWDYAREFADFANQHAPAVLASKLGLRRLLLDNPYDAPAGAIVVVRAGTPGTRHPRAGDITVASGDGKFYNGGEMNYHGRSAFPAGNDFVLGIYAPVD